MKHKLYTRLLSLALAVGLVIGMLPSAAAVDTVGGSAGQAATFADPDSPLKLDKTVTDNGNNRVDFFQETGIIDMNLL